MKKHKSVDNLHDQQRLQEMMDHELNLNLNRDLQELMDLDHQESTQDQSDRASTCHVNQDQVKEKIQTQPPKMQEDPKRRDSGTRSEKTCSLGTDVADGL